MGQEGTFLVQRYGVVVFSSVSLLGMGEVVWCGQEAEPDILIERVRLGNF